MIQTNERDSTTRIAESPRRETLRGLKQYPKFRELFLSLIRHAAEPNILYNCLQVAVYQLNNTTSFCCISYFEMSFLISFIFFILTFSSTTSVF